MREIKFIKFCASGNDFIAIDNRRHIVPAPEAEFVKSICRRKFSIGADGVLLLDKINSKFRMRIFNPDGSEPEMCGNGARAFAAFIYELGIASKNINFRTKAGEIRAGVSGRRVKIQMTSPEEIKLNISLKIKGRAYTGHFINTGVPHFVTMVKAIEKFPVKETGREIRFHKRFMPRGTNVDFISIRDDKIFLRTYERGVEDETLACGTGATASAIISNLLGRAGKIPVKLMARGGELKVYFKKGKQVSKGIGKFRDVYLEGDVRLIYKGKLIFHRPTS
jgi:diaminopimelate epimerase